MAFTRLSSIILVSAIFRLILILYGEWQDTHMEVRYTDVDYLVFSDAASLMASGKSPFQRSTYRYSPLLAFLLMPNTFIHRSWGKFLFSASDLLVSFFINAILKLRGVPENLCVFSVICWLFNPFTFTIGTRGNCEPIVCATVLWILLCLMNGDVFYKLHFVFQSGCRPALQKWSRTEQQSSSQGCWITRIARMFHPRFLMRCVLTRERILFGLISGAVFLFCTALFFCLYGWDFLHEALLYHLTRTDPRHNFSVYFYHIYLQYERKLLVVEKLISFLPQFIVQLVLILSFAQDLPFCFFVQTVAFVAFNKVVTAQYFVWFFCLLPLVLPWSNLKLNWKGLLCIIFWVGAQLHWLMWGYLLEFKGKNVFLQLWMASILFLAANTYLLISVIRNHRYSPVFTCLGTTNDDSRKLK